MRARIVYAHDDLLPYRSVILHLGVFPFVPDAVRVRVVLDHGGYREVPGCLGRRNGTRLYSEGGRDPPEDTIDPKRWPRKMRVGYDATDGVLVLIGRSDD